MACARCGKDHLSFVCPDDVYGKPDSIFAGHEARIRDLEARLATSESRNRREVDACCSSQKAELNRIIAASLAREKALLEAITDAIANEEAHNRGDASTAYHLREAIAANGGDHVSL